MLKTNCRERLYGSHLNYEGWWKFYWTSCGNLPEKCIFLVKGFAHVAFEHCFWESNRVAHILASKAEASQSVCGTVD
jgi:hypothetical protein